MRLTRFLSPLILAVASSGLASAAIAQTNPSNPPEITTTPRTQSLDTIFYAPPNRLQTIPEAFERAFFRESGDFYRNRRIDRQINYIIGAGIPGQAGFPDLELERDARRIGRLYKELLELQVASDPVFRTPDLPNPFDTSLRLQTSPFDARRFGNRLEGSEYIYETVPLPPTSR